MNDSIRIMIVEDQEEVREGLRLLIDGVEGYHCVAACRSAEEEILSYLAKGFLYKEIANELFINIETVRSHIQKIYRKLQVRTRAEVMLKYLSKS